MKNFKDSLCVKLKNATRIIYCCTWLHHNFCINEGEIVPEITTDDNLKELPPEYYIQCTRDLRGGQSQIRELVLKKLNLNRLRNKC